VSNGFQVSRWMLIVLIGCHRACIILANHFLSSKEVAYASGIIFVPRPTLLIRSLGDHTLGQSHRQPR
jgi:hypothetical protein